jgi:hypothetical protein
MGGHGFNCLPNDVLHPWGFVNLDEWKQHKDADEKVARTLYFASCHLKR